MMQYPDDIRRLELLRLARASTLPMHVGLDLASPRVLPAGGLIHVPIHPGLVSTIPTASLLYPGLATAVAPAAIPSAVLAPQAPLPLAVTRSLVQRTGTGLALPGAVPSALDASHVPSRGVPTLADYQRYQGDRALPEDFKPGPNSVIIGRKKNCYTSVGNLRLRDIVLVSLPAYSKCVKKKDKTEIVSRIVQMVRDSCPEGGAFIKCDSEGRWHEVSEVIARERVASIFRDFLHDQYRSSSKSKVAKRREKRAQELLQGAADDERSEKQAKTEDEDDKSDDDPSEAETSNDAQTTKDQEIKEPGKQESSEDGKQ